MAFKLAEAYIEFNQRGAAQVKNAASGIKQSFAGAASSAKLLAGGIAALGAAGAVHTLMGFVEAAAEAERQTAKLEAVLKSTDGVSGQTVASLEAHASALQKVTAFEDDTIKGAQAVLLTFKKIGGETFPQATEAALDLATVFEGDLKGSAMMVGKALEDPIRGITALRRAGVSFTEDQKNVIKALVETNDVAAAQAMILKEINAQVGGSAKAVGNTTFGQIEQLKNEMGDLAELIGAQLTPAVKGTVEVLRAWQFKLGGKAAMIDDFGKRAAVIEKRFMGAKTSAEAEAAQRDYYKLKKEFRDVGEIQAMGGMFGSYAANARIAELRGQEQDASRRWAGASRMGGRAMDVAGGVLGQQLGPAKAIADAVGGKIATESEWLKKQFDTSLRQERLLQSIYERLAPGQDVARFE